MRFWKDMGPQLLSVLRIAAAVMLIPAGTMKLFGWPMAMPPGSVLDFGSQIWWAGVLEVFGGLLLLLGLATRPVAFLLSGMLAVAYWQAHAHQGPWPAFNGGVPAALYSFVFLYISAAGPGPWSLDSLFRKAEAGPALKGELKHVGN
jgi:putative oxidoreductase